MNISLYRFGNNVISILAQKELDIYLPLWYKMVMHTVFQNWMNEAGYTASDLAEALNVAPAAVSRYLNGSRIPAPYVMVQLYTISHGEITPNDFYDLPDLNCRDGHSQSSHSGVRQNGRVVHGKKSPGRVAGVSSDVDSSRAKGRHRSGAYYLGVSA